MPPSTASRWESIRELWKIAIAIALGLGVLLVSWRQVGDVVDRVTFPVAQLSFALLWVVLFLMFQWLSATDEEIRILRENYDEFVPMPHANRLYIVIAIALFLSVAALSTRDIRVFSGLLVLYSVCDLWGQRTKHAEFAKMVVKTQAPGYASDPRTPNWHAIRRYYARPHAQRVGLMIGISSAGLVLGVVGSGVDTQQVANPATALAYLFAIINIVTSEWLIWQWRRARNATLVDF